MFYHFAKFYEWSIRQSKAKASASEVTTLWRYLFIIIIIIKRSLEV